MAHAATTSHPLEDVSKGSTDSLPTPPRSPPLEAQVAHLSTLEAGTAAVTPGASPALGSTLGYFPALSPTTSHDPLLLRERVQTDEQLSELRRRKKKAHGFYRAQNEQIDNLLKHIDDHVREAEEEEDNNRLAVRRLALPLPLPPSARADTCPLLQIKIAIYGSLAANWCVLVHCSAPSTPS